FGAGLLQGIAFTIHYNAGPLIVPFSLASVFVLWLTTRRAGRPISHVAYPGLALIAGTAVMPGVYDFVPCVLLRPPWRASPSLSYLYQFAVHKTEGFVRPIPLVEALGIWWLGMRSQWGALLLLAMGAGLIYFVARRWWGGLRSASSVRMAVLALTCAG